MKHKFLLLYSWFVRTLLFFLPDTPFLMRIRGYLYGICMKNCGKNFQVAHSAILNSIELFCIGHHVFIANGCIFIGNGEITIGDEVLFGPNVVISSGNHIFDSRSFRFAKSSKTRVQIGKYSWVCANSTIAGGAILPDNSILAANSALINLKVELAPKALYGGVPAKFIKHL